MKKYYIYQEDDGPLLVLEGPLVEGLEPGEAIDVEGGKTYTFLGVVEAKNSIELVQKIHEMVS